jgi:hypothetical protein
MQLNPCNKSDYHYQVVELKMEAKELKEEIDRLTSCAESQRLENLELRETIQRQADLIEQQKCGLI